MTAFPDTHPPIPPAGAATDKPGVIPLRPLGVGEILDGAIAVIRANPKVTLGVAAVVALIGQLLTIPTRILDGAPTATELPELGRFGHLMDLTSGGDITLVTSLVIGLLLTVQLNALLIPVIGGAVLGRRVELREAWAAGGFRTLGLFGVLVMTWARIALVMLAILVPGGLGG